MVRLSEEDLKIRARIWNLTLISNYKFYENIHSELEWECLECNYSFSKSVFNINQSKFPCPECSRNERNLPFYDMDNEIKECGWCHRILPLNSFDRTSIKRREKGGLQSYKSICRECEADLSIIRKFKKKYRLVTEHFNGSCYFCGVDLSFTFLPSTHFHHPQPKLKTSTWHIMRTRKYKEILHWAIRDKVIPLCANCHLIQQSKIVNLFEELILQKNLFEKTAKEINLYIDAAIAQNPKTIDINGDKKSKIKVAIRQWMRKRYIIEQMSDGVCVGCGNITVFNNLPAFVINHLDPTKKQSEWLDLHDLDCEKILNILIREKCIWICGNCHWIYHSNFYKLVKNIFKDLFTKDPIKRIELRLQQESRGIIRRVNNFKIESHRIDFRSPIRLEFNQWNVWRTYLLKIYYLTRRLDTDFFTINQITEHFGKSIHTHRYHLKRLLGKGVIEVYRSSGFLNRYKLSRAGVMEAMNIEIEHAQTAKEIKYSLENDEKD